MGISMENVMVPLEAIVVGMARTAGLDRQYTGFKQHFVLYKGIV